MGTAGWLLLGAGLLGLFSARLIPSDVLVLRRFLPDREVSSREAIEWIAYRSRWASQIAKDVRLEAAILEFDRKAKEGQLDVVGREQNTATFGKLDRDFWEIYGLDVIAHLKNPPICRTQERSVILYGHKRYVDLRVSERQVRKCWPAPIRDRLSTRSNSYCA